MNWKKLFEPHILERGYGYYLNNAVNNLEVSEHTIRADVEGTEAVSYTHLTLPTKA